MSDNKIPDFCTWEPTEQTINFNVNNQSYSNIMGHFGGIGNMQAAHKIYMQQFKTGKELYLGEIPFKTKTISFSANENLQGQNIDYYITPDGINWQSISKGQTIEIPINQIGDKFNWKAVLNTAHEGKTPRIYSTEICISNVGMPDNPRIIVGDTEIFNFTQTNGFNQELDITDAINTYLGTLPI